MSEDKYSQYKRGKNNKSLFGEKKNGKNMNPRQGGGKNNNGHTMSDAKVSRRSELHASNNSIEELYLINVADAWSR
eukprot:Awhi_evm1s3774